MSFLHLGTGQQNLAKRPFPKKQFTPHIKVLTMRKTIVKNILDRFLLILACRVCDVKVNRANASVCCLGQ
jgi:hypothetical protein